MEDVKYHILDYSRTVPYNLEADCHIKTSLYIKHVHYFSWQKYQSDFPFPTPLPKKKPVLMSSHPKTKQVQYCLAFSDLPELAGCYRPATDQVQQGITVKEVHN